MISSRWQIPRNRVTFSRVSPHVFKWHVCMYVSCVTGEGRITGLGGRTCLGNQVWDLSPCLGAPASRPWQGPGVRDGCGN